MCEDAVISAASTLPVKPSNEVLSSSTLDVDMCTDDSTQVVANHEVSDVIQPHITVQILGQNTCMGVI